MQKQRSDRLGNFDEPADASLLSASRAGPTVLSRLLYALALLPFLGFLVGAIFFNQVTPLVIGFPRLLAWLVLWILLTSLIMSAIYFLDPENTPVPAREESNR